MQSYYGELAALVTAGFWTITALAFERASLRIGSLSVNIIRLVMGFVFLSVFTFFYRDHWLPVDATGSQWFWLLASGLIGFVLGDLFLFKSFTIIGSRFSMLIMTLVPPITAFLGWILLGEKLSPMNFLGMFLTITGITMAIFSRGLGQRKLSLKLSPKGVLYAFGGAVGQSAGLVLSKLGMGNYDPFAATQIRIIAGIMGFILLITYLRRWPKVYQSFKNRLGIASTSLGAFFGPFLGVSFSLVAIQYTATGIASTIMSIVPVLIIPPAVLIYKQRVALIEVLGAIISVTGVALFFL